ncbi:MAG: hemerythrin domain-containing protein [Taibaiella sp.]|nr:hemerythrin domain-containing protein [Taibaiella sp.]
MKIEIVHSPKILATMSRYNVFLLVHKGLRAMMYDTSLSLQQTDFAYSDVIPESIQKLADTLDIIDAHAGHEDNYIFNLLEKVDAKLHSDMEAEHVTDHALSSKLRTLIAAYNAATDPAEKHQIGTDICLTFNDFIAFNLTHLNKEETIVNEALWKHYSDMDIIQANQQLVSSLTPQEAARSAVWMMRSCSNQELIKWINGIKNHIPPPMLQMLMGLAEQELPEERLAKVNEGINAG